MPSQEALELGLRLTSTREPGVAKIDTSKYSDWTPTTDHAVANSVTVGEFLVGRRCSFIGHEDQEGYNPSLNVEQLAMEFYHTGRLPATQNNNDPNERGGYRGWHDEGGLVRALFRILSYSVLGMDWGCPRTRPKMEETLISPYVGSPLDLHVGYELAEPLRSGGKETHCNRGFFLRRRHQIEHFLSIIASKSSQEISDLVWESIAARRNYMLAASRKDPTLEKDVLQCRTLSLAAAGFGGQMMASMFRCLFFDYRHYSGGLPDLLLVRAKFAGTTELVDLGDWVGEGFDAKTVAELEAQQRASLLDDSENFLGCSKVGDSGGAGSASSRNRSIIKGRHQQSDSKDAAGKRTSSLSLPELPPKLKLSHNGQNVEVECVFVEVKSSNDRLDPRQEDWLNILDRFGNARVCKFGDGSKSSDKRAKKEA